MANEVPKSNSIRVFGRLSFPRLDKPKAFEEGTDPRWEATFLLDPASQKGLEGIKTLLKEASALSKAAYGVDVPLEVRRLAARFIPGAGAPDPMAKPDGIEVSFYDGSIKEYDGYDGMFVVPSHNKRLKPAIANRSGKDVLPGEEQFPYAGCNVIGSIQIWAQVGETAKKYGKALRVDLRGVQFHSDNEAFGAAAIATEDEFQALEDDAVAAGAAGKDPWD